MITIKYSVTVTNDDPLLKELQENAKANDWWIGDNAEKTMTMFAKTFDVSRRDDLVMLQMRRSGE